MTRDEILKAPSMPAFAPSYPQGPFRFVRREYLIITYETDPEAIRAALPEPLEPAPGNLAFYEWMKMPDSSGFGDYEESGTGVFALYKGEPCNFSVQMYLDDEPPITGGREIWGFPKKYGIPRLKVIKDTLPGRCTTTTSASRWGPWPTNRSASPPRSTKSQRVLPNSTST